MVKGLSLFSILISVGLVSEQSYAARFSCSDFSPKESRECKDSKRDTGKCYVSVMGFIKKELTLNKKTESELYKSCFEELVDHCGSKNLYEGCRVEDGSKYDCTVWKVSKMRVDYSDKKKFPTKDMECLDKYKQYL